MPLEPTRAGTGLFQPPDESFVMAHPWMDENRPVYPGTVKEGYLVKSPPLDRRGKQWRQRWCVFTSTGNEPPCLLYFTDRQAVLTGRMPINRVPLESCSKVERALSHSSRPHVFAVHLPERVFYFSAVSHEEMMAWVDALLAHLKLKPQDAPNSSPPRAKTLERSTFSPPTAPPVLERSHSLQQPSKKDQPLPPLPFSAPPPALEPLGSEEPPPLPERPEELKYGKTPPPPL